MKTYAVADLHGQYDLWCKIKEILQSDDVLYLLGDCNDRGPDGWKIIKEVLTDPRVKYVRGNHEQMLLESWKSEWRDNHLWFYNGGYETFESILADANAEIYLKQLNRTLYKYEYINKNYQTILLSHAGYTLFEDDRDPFDKDLLWDRDHIFGRNDWWPDTNPSVYVVHGHTPVGSSVFKQRDVLIPEDTKFNSTRTVCRYTHGHKICIDAGCFSTHQIALLDLDTLEERVIK